MTDAHEAVMFDIGRVLIHPQNEPFRRAAHELCGIALTNESIETALARTVWFGAQTDDPTEFWRGTGKSAAWGEFVGMSSPDATRVWAAVADGDTTQNPLWSVADPLGTDVLVDLRRRGVKTAAVSNGDGELRRDLARHGFLAHFDVVLDSHVEGLVKPDPAIFLRASRMLGVPIERCAFVGDDPYFDYAASLNAGIGTACLIDHKGVRPRDWGGLAGDSLASVLAMLSLRDMSSRMTT